MIAAPHEPAATTSDRKGTKQRILAAAIELFSCHGFSGVSMRDIARAVGVKESSIYNHFAGKDALMDNILALYQSEVTKTGPPETDLAAKIAAMPPKTFLLTGLSRTLAAMANPTMEQITRIILMEQFRDSRAREMVLATISQPLAFAEKVFTVMVEQGLLQKLDPKLLAAEYEYPLNAMFLEYTLLKYSGQSTDQIEQRMADHVRFFVKHFCA